MPIKSMSAAQDHGSLIQVCAGCGAEHTISFNRGAQKSKRGPVSLQPGDTLVVQVDAQDPVTVIFAAGDFARFQAATAAELATKLLAHIPGVRARDDAGGLLLESELAGELSRIQIIGGTARTALGFATGVADPCTGRPVLGVDAGAGLHNKDVIALRRCNDCGANECLVRTFDVAGVTHEGSHFGEHRKTVNALAQHAKAQGWSHASVAAAHAVEASHPVDIDHAFPSAPSEPGQRVRRVQQANEG